VVKAAAPGAPSANAASHCLQGSSADKTFREDASPVVAPVNSTAQLASIARGERLVMMHRGDVIAALQAAFKQLVLARAASACACDEGVARVYDVCNYGVTSFGANGPKCFALAYQMRKLVLDAAHMAAFGAKEANALSRSIRSAAAAESTKYFSISESVLWFLGRMYAGPYHHNLDDFDVQAMITAFAKHYLAAETGTTKRTNPDGYAEQVKNIRQVVMEAIGQYASRAVDTEDDGYGGWTLHWRGKQAWMAMSTTKRNRIVTGDVVVAAAAARRRRKARLAAKFMAAAEAASLAHAESQLHASAHAKA
jgi:hypothetical protein